MSKLLKALALLTLVTTLVWGVTVWHWQRTNRDISTYEIAFHLFLLPAALSIVAWGLYALGGRLLKAPIAGPTAPVASAAQPPADAPIAPERLWATPVLFAAGQAGPCASLDETLAALASGSLRPDVDPELVDAQGLPVLASRAIGLDLDALRAELDELLPVLQRLHPEWAELAVSPAFERALGLLREPLEEALAALAPYQPALAPAPAPREPGITPSMPLVPPPAPGAAAAPRPALLRLMLCTPAAWSVLERSLARMWIGKLAVAAMPELPLENWIVVQPCANGEQALQHLDHFLASARREAQPALLLALATESHLTQQQVDRLSQQGQLFSSDQPHGRMPGESAVALLLSTAGAASDAPAPPPWALAHRLAVARRDQPAPTTGRSSSATLESALGAALLACTQPAEAIACIYSDLDLRPARTQEAAQALLAALPHLDAVADMRAIGQALGDAGLPRALLALALAAAAVRDTTRPALAFTVHDPLERAALALLPA